jgi:uncharacterized repeat protein (TIGR01451 family)
MGLSPYNTEALGLWGYGGMLNRGILVLVLVACALVSAGVQMAGATAGTDLQISVSAPASATIGQVPTFNYTLSNAGDQTATNVTFTISLPRGASVGFYDPGYPDCLAQSSASVVVCTYASIPAGESRAVRLDLFLHTLGSNTSVASVTSDTFDPNTSNNSASGTVDVQGETADAFASLTGPVGDMAVGDFAAYHLTFGNLGPAQIYEPITVVVTLPPEISTFGGLASDDPGGTSCSLGDAGAFTCSGTFASCTYAGGTARSFSCTMYDPLSGYGPAWYETAHIFFYATTTTTGTATTSAVIQPITGLTDANPANDSARVITRIFAPGTPRADLVLSQSAPSSTAWDKDFSYDFTVSNVGPDSAGPVTISDTLPGNVSFVSATGATCSGTTSLSCTIPALASGQQQAVSITVHPVAPGDATNTAVATGPEVDGNIMNNTAAATTTVTPQPGIDLSGTLSGPVTTTLGQNYAYRFTVMNTGTDTVTNPLVNTYFLAAGFDNILATSSDGATPCSLGAGGSSDGTVTIVICRIPSLGPGQTWSVDVNMRPLAIGDFTFGGQVTLFSGSDPSPEDNSDSFNLHVDPAPPPSMTCPADVTTSTDPGLSTATIAVGTPTVSEGTPPVEVDGVRSDGAALDAPYPLGTTQIAWTATDAFNYTANCSQAIQVRDMETPVSTAAAPADWSNAPVTVHISGNDNVAVSEIDVSATGDGAFPEESLPGDSADITVSAEGTTILRYRAVDSSGNVEAAQTVTINIDEHAPEIVCAGPDGSWHAANISLACTASDGGSGLARPSDASFELSTTVADGEETADAPTGSRTVCDQAGNCAQAGPIAGNKIDQKAPTISLVTPADGASLVIGASVPVSYTCSDGGSGMALCTGTIASGALLDTSNPGTGTFEVQASDEAGNQATVTHSYTVGYGLCNLQLPSAAGGALPIRFELCDAAGDNLSSPGLSVTAVALDGEAIPDTHPHSDGSFRLAGGQYMYTLHLPKSLSPGTHHLQISVAGDPAEHVMDFEVR